MIRNIKDLQKAIEPYIINAMELTGKTIYEKLKGKVEAYYSEEVFREPDKSTPDVYQRTDMLKNSLFEPIIEKRGNTYSFSTGFEDDYLTYEYPGNPEWKRNIPATGQDVLEWFNASSHGGIVKGKDDFWDEAIEEINSEYGGITNLFKQNCKKVGLPVK